MPFFQPDWPRSPLRGRDVAGIVFLVVLAVFFSGGISYRLDPPAGLHIAPLLFYGTVAGLVFAIAIAGRGATWWQLGLRPTSRRSLGLALGMAVPTYLLVWPVELGLEAIAGEDYPNPWFEAHLLSVPSWPWWFPEIMLTMGIAPLVEELFFRGMFYGWLRQKTSPAVAIVGSSLLFALYHGDLIMSPIFFIYGAVFALVYERSRSVWPAVATHGALNGLVLISWHVF